MSGQQRPDARRGAGGRSARRVASASKRRLETLPELPAGDLDELPAPPANPETDSAQDRAAEAPANVSGDNASGRAVSIAETKNGRSGSADSDPPPPADSEQPKRPRNRTAPPWRGRGRSGGSIFTRAASARTAAAAGSAAGATSSSVRDASSPVGGAAVRGSAPNSAGLVSERSGTVAEDPALVSTVRRRGHTLGPEQLAERRLSTADAAGPAAGAAGDAHLSDNRRVHSATASHFHVATENTTLSLHSHPGPPSKNGSASPANTVATLEIDGNSDADQVMDQPSAAPKGQLSKMLYQETPRDGWRGTPSARATQQPVGSRARLGGVGDYRGAVMRQPAQSVFVNRPRHASGEQSDAGAAYDDNDQMLPAGMGLEIPGAAPGSGTDPQQYRHYAQAARRPMRTGSGASDAAGDVMLSAGGPPVHQPTPRLARMPTLPLQTAFVGDDRYYAMHAPVAPTGILYAQAPNSAALPSTRGTAIPGAAGDAALSGRALSGEIGERFRLASSADIHYEYLGHSRVLPGQTLRPPSVQPANPWSNVPRASRRSLIKFEIGGRWNALAAAPDGALKCAIVGRDGLFTNVMEGDGSAPQLHQLSSRRLTSAQDMHCVLWQPAYHIATGSANGHVFIWDPTRTSDGVVQKYTDSTRRVTGMAYKPDEPRVIYVAYANGEIVGWDTRTKGRRTTFHTNTIAAPQDIDCSQQDANSLAAITGEGVVLTWDVRSAKKEARRIFAHGAAQGCSIAWHPTGRFIASSGNDQYIKIWDLKATSIVKLSPSPYCSIRTVGNIHQLKWRPGNDTQLASCSMAPHTNLSVWDMHNPNHSLMYHIQHNTPIAGFAWHDENTVWSVGSREQLIQCDMQSDAIRTSGLLPNTVATFSPNTRICVATGEHESRHSRALDWTMSQRFYASALWPANEAPAANSLGDPRRATGVDMFLPDLPRPFVDEHVLDESILIKADVVKFLARSYRYDPDSFKECCETNARAALTVRLPDMAKFWQVLSTVFGDARPLKPRRRPKAVREREQQNTDQDNPESQPPTIVLPNSTSGAHSAATSRSSSGMFVSKSVTSIVQNGDSSDDDDDDDGGADEPAARGLGRRRTVPAARSLTVTTPADIRQSLSACSLGIAGNRLVPRARPGRQGHSAAGAGRFERGYTSLSHSNLQQAGVAVSRSRSRVPSPLSRPSPQRIARPSGSCTSEPATPAHHQLGQHKFQGPPAGQGAALGATHGQAQHNDPLVPLTSLQRRLLFHTDAAPPPPTGKQQGTAAGMPHARRPMFALGGAAATAAEEAEVAAGSSKLSTDAQRRVSRADLQLAVESCTYYANKGDVQTALTAALLLRRFIRIGQWPGIRGWFIDYIDRLDQHQEHAVATDIILVCPFPDIPDQLNDRNNIVLTCSQCDNKLDCHPDAGFAWCLVCQRAPSSCVVCQMPVSGRFIWCKGCNHGGHADHIREWFEDLGQHTCPSGCGHTCQLDPID